MLQAPPLVDQSSVPPRHTLDAHEQLSPLEIAHLRNLCAIESNSLSRWLDVFDPLDDLRCELVASIARLETTISKLRAMESVWYGDP